MLATVGLAAMVLRLALPGEAGIVAPAIFVAHLPIAAVEGVVCGFAGGFLIGVSQMSWPFQTGPIGKTSSNGTSH